MKALLLVDLQNDFCPGGALAVPEGNTVIPLANALMKNVDLVVATQDWHPANHGSFAANHVGKNVFEMIDLAGLPQVLWPVHCVQNTPGAAFVSELNVKGIHNVFQKGTDPSIDSYSGFFDNGHRKATGLGEYLKQKGVTDVYVLGLATDYCVKATALDAARLGYETLLLTEAIAAVNLDPGDGARSIEEMTAAGVNLWPTAIR